MNLLVVAAFWGVGVGVIGVVIGLLLKKDVGADLGEIIFSFLGTLILLGILILAGEHRFLTVDLANGAQVVVFLIVSSLFNWFAKAVIVARFIGE